MVLITETPNGEHYNVLPAMYMNLGGGSPSLGEKAEGIVGWWGIAGSRRTGEGGDCQLPVRLKPLACTPICWMPLPPMEDVSKLERRLSQLLRFDVLSALKDGDSHCWTATSGRESGRLGRPLTLSLDRPVGALSRNCSGGNL